VVVLRSRTTRLSLAENRIRVPLPRNRLVDAVEEDLDDERPVSDR
jgi:hypothetical protein